MVAPKPIFITSRLFETTAPAIALHLEIVDDTASTIVSAIRSLSRNVPSSRDSDLSAQYALAWNTALAAAERMVEEVIRSIESRDAPVLSKLGAGRAPLDPPIALWTPPASPLTLAALAEARKLLADSWQAIHHGSEIRVSS